MYIKILNWIMVFFFGYAVGASVMHHQRKSELQKEKERGGFCCTAAYVFARH